jgi:hypothetical protein
MSSLTRQNRDRARRPASRILGHTPSINRGAVRDERPDRSRRGHRRTETRHLRQAGGDGRSVVAADRAAEPLQRSSPHDRAAARNAYRDRRRAQPCGPYAPAEAAVIEQQVSARDLELGQALRFILSSGARIDEVLHLRADKVSLPEKQVDVLGNGGTTHNIRVLDSTTLTELDLSRPFVDLPMQRDRQWKDCLEW